MTRLPIMSEAVGKQVSWIGIQDGTATFADALAEKLFSTYRDLLAVGDQETFDKLATGWSNGYLTIPAQ